MIAVSTQEGPPVEGMASPPDVDQDTAAYVVALAVLFSRI